MWPFDYFKKKKEESVEKKQQEELYKVQLKKEKYNKCKTYVDDIIFNHKKIEDEKRDAYIDKVKEGNKLHNQSCPRCKSKNIIQIFNRPKGELKGSFNSNSSHYSHLTSSYSSHYSSGKIDGKLDTLKVNKCKDCGQEWERKDEEQMIYSSDWYPNKCNRNENVPIFLRRVWYLIKDVEEYNPNKLDNPCDSVQEFIEMKKEEICERWGNGISDLSMEVLYYYARINAFSLCFDDEILEEYDSDDGGELYLGKFTPKMENFLIDELGFEYHFKD